MDMTEVLKAKSCAGLMLSKIKKSTYSWNGQPMVCVPINGKRVFYLNLVTSCKIFTGFTINLKLEPLHLCNFKCRAIFKGRKTTTI